MSIKIKALHKSYGDKKVLNDINLHIQKGSIFGLLGVNGAGKTTLLSILNFLEKEDEGSIFIEDFSASKQAKKIKNISSYVPQSFAFYPNLNAYENLEFFASLHGLKGLELKNRIDEVLKICFLDSEAKNKARKYSGGYKRRLNLAIALLNRPKILYLDEPTVGVDTHTRKSILQTIKFLQENFQTTIFYTSHYMEEISYICDDIAILHQGNILLHDKKDKLLSEYENLEYLFLKLTKSELI